MENAFSEYFSKELTYPDSYCPLAVGCSHLHYPTPVIQANIVVFLNLKQEDDVSSGFQGLRSV
jgi:hypothetical protein